VKRGPLATALLIISASFNLSYHSTSVDPFQEIIRTGHFMLDTTDKWVDSVFNSLSRDERIAQLLMIPAYSGKGQDHVDEILRLIKKDKIGGIIFFQGGPARQAYLTNLFQQASQTPLLVAMDAEWGLGMRLDSSISYPRQLMLGALTDDSLIWQMGYDIAAQLRRIGVHMNFAPVVDINNNPDNPVIDNRSFGENMKKVSWKGIMYMKGLQDNGLLCTAKHFPGHGDTDRDSHHELPVIMHDYDRLRSVELYPFRECIAAGLSGIMVAHLSLPLIDPVENRPSSLSPKMVTDLLKNKMGFQGLIVTDAMNMAGVNGYKNPGDAEALALAAGNDIVLMPSDVNKTISAVKREIRKGTISWQDIDARCKKILAAKKWAGLNKYQAADLAGIDKDLQAGRFKLTASRLVEQSLTLLANQGELVPLQRIDTLKILSVTIGQDSLNEFNKYLDLYTDVTSRQYRMDLSTQDMAEIMELADDHNLLIISIYGTFQGKIDNYGISFPVIEKIRTLADSAVVILSVFANPYILEQFGTPGKYRAVIMAYENTALSQRFAAQLIFGGIPAKGRLPVSSGNFYQEGDGMNTDHYFRFKYSIPEESMLDAVRLRGIDSLVLDAISKEAMPGCQVLVARNGVVVYHKAFGYHTYDTTRPVELSDLYDLASVTKILATVPCLMKLVDEKRIDVDERLSAYLPGLDSATTGNLIIKEILSHKSGLAAWIPFYLSTIEPMNPREPLIARQLSASYPFRLDMITYVNRNTRYVDSIYSTEYSPDYPIQVAGRLFLQKAYPDTIFRKICHSELSGTKEYKYSDLGFYLCKQIIETLTDSSIYDYAYHNFYKYIGTGTLGYLPLNRFPRDRIVPTENDLVFRRQLLQGYVHDPGAAMLGGIGGHAGLFSNANDLAKIMQMYLQKGFYGGRRFISRETFDLFNTSYYHEEGVRRGLGFDKPEPDETKTGPTIPDVSASSFGHSGFTGTYTWADPESGLLYVFLSNRIYPDQDNTRLYDMNVRTNIQQVIQDAIIKF
jgi:beta-glucosidase-like glycosyl hydrolase/CubicO group peptidase (beta-lactamase class C family)